jgi:hypothetical protein
MKKNFIQQMLSSYLPSDFWGVRAVGDTETDYQLATGILDLPKAKYSFAGTTYQQAEVAKSCCTLCGSAGAYTDQTGFEFSIAQLKDMWELAKKDGAGDDGWEIAKAVKLVKVEGNKLSGFNMMFYALNLDSEEAYDVVDKGYTLVVGYRGNSAYNKDKNDGTLDLTALTNKSTYGHCLRGNAPVLQMVDSAPKTSPKNIYQIPKDNIDDLVRNRVFYRQAYVYADATIEAESELWGRVPLYAKNSYKKAVAKGIILDISNPLKIVGDANAEKIYFKLGALTKLEGNLTEARLIVALDRLNQF